jgi:hypothetical protein
MYGYLGIREDLIEEASCEEFYEEAKNVVKKWTFFGHKLNITCPVFQFHNPFLPK